MQQRLAQRLRRAGQLMSGLVQQADAARHLRLPQWQAAGAQFLHLLPTQLWHGADA